MGTASDRAIGPTSAAGRSELSGGGAIISPSAIWLFSGLADPLKTLALRYNQGE